MTEKISTNGNGAATADGRPATADRPVGGGSSTPRRRAALSPENQAVIQLTRKDFVSDQEVRWCPGCGDYSILAQTQKVMPDFGYPQENIVFISRHRLLRPAAVLHEHVRLPHHPRPRADARDRPQGRPARPDGVGHHRRRRRAVDRRQPRAALDAPQRRHQADHVQQPHLRPDQGPGLADVRARQEDEVDRRSGTIDYPIQPLSVALAAEATFVARSVDTHTEHLQETLERAGRHKGSAFVEVLQNCNIFNDGAWRSFTDREVRDDRMLVLEHGKPMIFGKERDKGIRLRGLHPEVVELGNGVTEEDLLVHDETAEDPYLAFMLSRMWYPDFPVPVGVLRRVERPTHDQLMTEQITTARQQRGEGDLPGCSTAAKPGR